MKIIFSIILVGLLAFETMADDWQANTWPGFRGPLGNPVAERGPVPPESFDLRSGENVAWSVELPGRGPAAPIVAGGTVFVTASDGLPQQDRLHLLAFDAQSGRLRWHRRWFATGKTWVHPFGAVAQNTPCSDGRKVVAYYSSNDLVCFDMDGNLLWQRGLGFEHPRARNDTGMASSPCIRL